MKQKKVKELLKFSKDLKVLYVEDSPEAREQALKMLENFFQNIELSQSTDKFVLYCHSGQRTYLALQKLKNSNIYHLAGGILNWIEAGESVRQT